MTEQPKTEAPGVEGVPRRTVDVTAGGPPGRVGESGSEQVRPPVEPTPSPPESVEQLAIDHQQEASAILSRVFNNTEGSGGRLVVEIVKILRERDRLREALPGLVDTVRKESLREAEAKVQAGWASWRGDEDAADRLDDAEQEAKDAAENAVKEIRRLLSGGTDG